MNKVKLLMLHEFDLRLLKAALPVVCSGLLLSACGGGDAPGGDESAAAGQSQGAAPAPIAERLAGADLERGKTLYFQCRACHSLNEGGANKVGPNLYGIFGQRAGVVPGFAYSAVFTGADIVWDAAAMDDWLARPSEFLPGNRMVFVGVKDPQDRANLIAYLKQETGAE